MLGSRHRRTAPRELAFSLAPAGRGVDCTHSSVFAHPRARPRANGAAAAAITLPYFTARGPRHHRPRGTALPSPSGASLGTPRARGLLGRALPEKAAEACELRTALAKFVRSHYGSSVTGLEDDLDCLVARRAAALKPDAPPLAKAEGLRVWLTTLADLETRFPLNDRSDGVMAEFMWSDAFRPGHRQRSASSHLERAACLFNLAAALSAQGAEADRSNAVGLGRASRCFQDAAGVLAHLRSDVAPRLEGASCPVDLSPACLALLERTLLAEAQECCYESAVAGGKSPATLARLALACGDTYAEAHCEWTPELAAHLDRSWGLCPDVLANLHRGLAEAHAAEVHRAQDANGPELARLRRAAELLGPAGAGAAIGQLPPDAGADLPAAVARALGDVEVRIARAEKENRSVYMCRVPAHTTLTALAPALLVRPTGPESVLATADAVEPLFSSVVPEDVAREISRFAGGVDELVRDRIGALEDATEGAQLAMALAGLPDALLDLEPRGAEALPASLRSELKRFDALGGAIALRSATGQIASMSDLARRELDKLSSVLDAEQRDDDELRTRLGVQWRRAPSAELAAPLREDVSRLSGRAWVSCGSGPLQIPTNCATGTIPVPVPILVLVRASTPSPSSHTRSSPVTWPRRRQPTQRSPPRWTSCCMGPWPLPLPQPTLWHGLCRASWSRKSRSWVPSLPLLRLRPYETPLSPPNASRPGVWRWKRVLGRNGRWCCRPSPPSS